MKLYSCTLPFPPSVNTCFSGKPTGKMRYKSDAYKQWENKSKLVCKKGLTISDPIRAEYIFFVPDKRTRDIENYSKCVSDFLVNQRVIEDDGHHIIKALDLRFGGFDKGNPRVEISIYPVGAA